MKKTVALFIIVLLAVLPVTSTLAASTPAVLETQAAPDGVYSPYVYQTNAVNHSKLKIIGPKSNASFPSGYKLFTQISANGLKGKYVMVEIHRAGEMTPVGDAFRYTIATQKGVQPIFTKNALVNVKFRTSAFPNSANYLAPGAYDIYALVFNDETFTNMIYMDSVRINVSATPAMLTVNASAVNISQPRLYLVKGKTATVKATVYPSNASIKDIYWSSDNASIASVSPAGKITAKKAGVTFINARSANGKNAWFLIRVVNAADAAPATNVSLVKPPKTIKVGIENSKKLTAKYAPSYATKAIVSYKSSKPSVLMVDAGGRIYGIKPGRASITVKAGRVTKKYVITVKAP